MSDPAPADDVPSACRPAASGSRRDDAEQRIWLAERLERGKQGMERYARALVDAMQLDAVTQLDRLRGQTDQLCGRIRGAVQGGSGKGFQDAILNCGENEAARAERIYQHDLTLIELTAATADAMESLGEQPTDANRTLTTIAANLAQLSDAWDVREDLLRE